MLVERERLEEEEEEEEEEQQQQQQRFGGGQGRSPPPALSFSSLLFRVASAPELLALERTMKTAVVEKAGSRFVLSRAAEAKASIG